MTGETSQPLITFGPRIRKSPFFEATRRWGCKAYTTYNHMYMPVYYESPAADYRRLVEHVTLWDVAGERQVEITGPDAARFAQYLTPRNLSKCAVGQCKYALVTDEAGGIINDPVLLKLAEDRFWYSLADSDVLLWAKGLALGGGFDVGLGEPDVSPLQLQGPKADDVAKALFGDWIDELRFFRCRETELDGIPLVISRSGWSTAGGFEIYLRDGSRGDALWERIMEAGKPFEIGPAAPNQISRIEGGLLSYGGDMTLEHNPFELGLDRFVDLEMEAEYVGKDALRRIKAEGVSRILVGLEIDGAPLEGSNTDRWPVLASGAPVGSAPSCVYSPRLERNIGLAIVSVAHRAIGTALTVAAPGGARTATVVSVPFQP